MIILKLVIFTQMFGHKKLSRDENNIVYAFRGHVAGLSISERTYEKNKRGAFCFTSAQRVG